MGKYPPVVVVDIETTGLNPETDSIIEVAAVKLVRGEVVDNFQSLVRFDGDLSAYIRHLTGISPGELLRAPSWDEVKRELKEFCTDDCIVAAHNVKFEEQFLQVNDFPLPARLIDTLELARVFFPSFPSHSLEYLQGVLLGDSTTGHRALPDALNTTRLLQILTEKVHSLDVTTVRRVVTVAPESWRGKPLFKLALANMAWEGKSGDDSPQVKDRNRDKPPVSDDIAFTWKNIQELFTGKKGIAAVIEQYEQRPQQLSMAGQVFNALNDNKSLVVEAETGTGKTMAYLVPASIWSLNSGERVVICTNTLSLQQQLWEKDIPLLQKILPGQFNAALLKGRTNYLCLRKWNYWLTQVENLPDWMRVFFVTVSIWQEHTATGDKSELNLNQTRLEVWQKICAEGETCWGSTCTWFKNCYVSKAKRKAAGANIIVANHSLVLADAFSDYQVLPDFSRLIIDEAHHFEETAAKQLGISIYSQQITSLLQEINNQKPPLQFAAVFPRREINNLHKTAEELARDAGELAVFTREYLTGAGESCLRITPAVVHSPFWSRWHKTANIIRDKCKFVLDLLENIQEEIARLDMVSDSWEKELHGLGKKVAGIIDDFSKILLVDDQDFVTWFELNRKDAVSLHRCPINVGPLLQDFYANFDSLIFTSATVTINNRFKFFEESLGLGELMPIYSKVGSPFNHARQSLFCVPKNLPPANHKDFLYRAIPLVEDVISTLQGSTLVLFTSHQMLRDCYYRLKPSLRKNGIKLLGQGIDGDRWQLVEQLKSDAATVILGAQSFWEGVDVPGDNLRCVIIMRLPFLPPTDPAVAARLERLEKQQKNSFYHLSLPLAILRFKQGIGRLIRTSRDRGVIMVLDTRIINRRYGRYFLNSLPGTAANLILAEEVSAVLNNFFTK